MLFRLKHIWFSGTITRLARLGRPRGAETRRRPYMVCVGDGCKIRHCKKEVLIALVSVLDIMPLAIIHAVACVYNKWLRVRCLIN